MFFGPNGLPCGRYYDTDGIHMSHSGAKRLIHAINKHVLVAHDFQSCVFRGQQQSWGNRRRPSPGHYQGGNSRAMQYGRGNRDFDLRDNGQIRGVLVLHVPCLVMSSLNVGLPTRG